MNKIIKALTCAALGSAMLFTVACNNNTGNEDIDNGGGSGQKWNTESRWLSLAIGALDGVFNPYFATSLTDNKVISMTQASLITSDVDSKGNAIPVAGDNYPTIAKDYDVKYYTDMTVGSGRECDSSEAAENGRTEYSFLIKKDMKFSDGEPLTIKDVLFNFYVYLDPSYIGSNTMYSVDIQGLNAYRNNNSALRDDETAGTGYASKAQARITELIEYGAGTGSTTTLTEQGQKDYDRVKELFREELQSDWNSMASSWTQTYEINYTFDATWQAYLFQEGLIEAQRKQYPIGDGQYMIKEVRVDPETRVEIDPVPEENKLAYANGKILTTLDEYVSGAYGHSTETGMKGAQTILDEIAEREGDEAIKDYCIEKVFQNYLGDKSGLDDVLSFWATASTAYNEFLAEERGKAIQDSENPQYFISGIRAEKTSTFKGQPLDGEYDVLKIIVNRVDPAAIWQFGITVAPLHYYSGTYGDKDYVKDFNGDTAITDYSSDGDLNGDKQDNDICFGVKRGDSTFFRTIIQKPDKNGLPVGAGPYKAANENGNETNNRNDFYKNNNVNYVRNEFFYTMGEQIGNAKIKNIRYKVVDESRIINNVENGEIDYGEPNATQTNKQNIESKLDIFGMKDYNTNGFGYVGVNPKFVPVLGIRQIIMRAMNRELSIMYYGDLGDIIERPMSLTSWAYPDNPSTWFKPLGSDKDVKDELIRLGCTEGSDHVFMDKYGNKLKYTFTIAGANTDHPAYNMFNMAAQKLNQCGFDITVSGDPNALLELTRGGLAVWAAAWSSGVDPDMYQVYHKDSQASSIVNWGYKEIYANTDEKFQTERGIIDDLSKKIIEARRTTDQDERKSIYSDCLDYVMDLAVELPVYQRKDLCIYNKNVLDPESLYKNANATVGLIDRIWEVNYL